VYGIINPGETIPSAISFGIPLSASPEKAFYCNREQTEEAKGECPNASEPKGTPVKGAEAVCKGPGSKPAAPPPGVLCIYTVLEADQESELAVITGPEGEEQSGVFLLYSGLLGVSAAKPGHVDRLGLYAVTAK
jgi:hypothetical protein